VKKEPVKKAVAQIELLSVDDYASDGVKTEIEMKTHTDADLEDEEEKEDGSELTATTDVDMLHSLTGQPLAEDELLFAIPVVAPYNSIINYK
jgi:hypothetical protein